MNDQMVLLLLLWYLNHVFYYDEMNDSFFSSEREMNESQKILQESG